MGEIEVAVQNAVPTGVTLRFKAAGDSDLVSLPLAPEHGTAIAAVLATDPFPRKPGTLSYSIVEVSEARGKARKATILTRKGRSRAKASVEVPESVYLLIQRCWREGKLPYELSGKAVRR